MTGATLDFVVPDPRKLMALLAILSRSVYNLEDETDSNDLMKIYLQLKIKMKLSYECYRRKAKLPDILIRGITKTVKERCNLAISDLQEFIDRVSDVNTQIKNDQEVCSSRK